MIAHHLDGKPQQRIESMSETDLVTINKLTFSRANRLIFDQVSLQEIGRAHV